MINKIILLGRIGKEPQQAFTGSGALACNMSLATTKKNRKKEEVVTWHDIVAYGNLAKVCLANIKKGSLIYVEGEIVKHSFDSARSGGSKTTKVIVNIGTIKFLDKKEDSNQQQSFSDTLGNA